MPAARPGAGQATLAPHDPAPSPCPRIAAAPVTHRDPELFALLHRGTPGDLAFYRARSAGAARVLELGCGHGRVVLALARAGRVVTGLDRDAGLLALAARGVATAPPAVRQRVTLIEGDMRGFALAGVFDRILLPYNGIYCLGSDAEVIACLRSAAAHLAPGGGIVFDAWSADAFHAEADPQDEDPDDGAPVDSVTWRGRVYDVFESSEWQRDAQCIRVRYRYRPRRGGAEVEDRIAHRYLLTDQIPALAAAAGLRVAQAWGGFAGQPLGGDSEHIAYLLRAAPGP